MHFLELLQPLRGSLIIPLQRDYVIQQILAPENTKPEEVITLGSPMKSAFGGAIFMVTARILECKPRRVTCLKIVQMPGTFSQVYIHIVFAVKGRENLISNRWKSDMHKYIAGIIKGKGHKPIIVNGMRDHIHAFVGLRPVMAISDLVRDIKNNSSNFINRHKFVYGKFSLQNGYGAFSYSHSHIGIVYDYILNQEKHHEKKMFREEYTELLKKFDVEFDQAYLFESYD